MFTSRVSFIDLTQIWNWRHKVQCKVPEIFWVPPPNFLLCPQLRRH